MAKLGAAFNAQAIPPADPDGGANLPIGLIPVRIDGNSLETNSNGSGQRFDMHLTGVHGPGMGVKVKFGLNLFHQGSDAAKSQQAREIAAKQLSAICYATGVYDLGAEGDLDRLNGKMMIAVVESQNDPQHPDRTKIVGFADVNGMKPGQPTVPVRVREAVASAPAQQTAPAAAWAPPPAAQPPQQATPAAAVAFGPSSAAAPVAQPGFAPAAQPAAPAWPAPAAAQAQPAAPAAGGVPSWAQGR